MKEKPRFINAVDENGKTFRVARKVFEEHILHDILWEAKKNPFELAMIILQGVEDGFAGQLDDAARRLQTISHDPEDAALIRAHVLREAGNLEKAIDVLNEYQKDHGYSARVHCCIGDITIGKGDKQAGREILIEGLRDDPNILAAIATLNQVNMELGGEQQLSLGLRELAGVRGAWLPQLVRAGLAFNDGNHGQLLQVFRDCAGQAAKEGNALTLTCGSLYEHGFLPEILEFIRPHYNPDRHDPAVGLMILSATSALRPPFEARDFLTLLWNRWPPHLRKELQPAYDALYPQPWYRRLARIFQRR